VSERLTPRYDVCVDLEASMTIFRLTVASQRLPDAARRGPVARALIAVALGALLMTACSGRRARAERLVSVTRLIGAVEILGPTDAWAPAPDAMELLPVGRWIAVGDEIAYTYVDHQMGLSARIQPDGDRARIRRLELAPAGARVLEPAEVAARGLPEVPDFVASYGEQPEPGAMFGHWRSAEGLAHRWHPEFPDDLLVVLITEREPQLYPEVIWVRVFDCDGLRCRGGLINQPHRGGLKIGNVVRFDASDVPLDRPPPAESAHEPLTPELRSLLLTNPAFANLVADPEAWDPDLELPRADRMPPIGRWFVLGDELCFGVVTDEGPIALRFREGSVMTQTMPWLPRRAQLLTEEQIAAAKLPPSPPLKGLPPQPAPGTWGSWRLRDELAWMFRISGEPDVVVAVIDGGSAPARVRLRECSEHVCVGALDAAVGDHKKGALFEMGTLSAGGLRPAGADHPIEPGAHELPVAWPKGTMPKTSGEALLDGLRQGR